MTRYWIIAPYDATKAEKWEKIWQYDLQNNVISIGWGNLGDVSNYEEDQLKATIAHAYPDKNNATKTKYFRMIWDFFHTIKPNDVIIARKGTKSIAAVGFVTQAAYFSQEQNDEARDPDDPHFNYLGVQWLDAPRDKTFAAPVFGIQTITSCSYTQFNQLVGAALYLNGVYQSVLKEILTAQEEQLALICYLQPYKSHQIKYLAEANPTINNPIQLYISTSDNLEQVSYRAKIVGWQDKQMIPDHELEKLNEHIHRFQPGEGEIYETQNGTLCKNLLAIQFLERLPCPFPISKLIKTSDIKPYKTRSQSGGWAPVFMLPEWFGTLQSLEQLESDFAEKVKQTQNLSSGQRLERLKQASKMPKKVHVTSIAYNRNPDVIAEVLARADGKCEKCGKDAPFLRASDGTPYLEVHHWLPLAKGGEDTVDNAGALCPNCHREAHYG